VLPNASNSVRASTSIRASDSLVGARRSVVENHSPRPLFLSYPQSFMLLLPTAIYGQFSVRSVQLRVTRTRIRTVLPTFCGTPRPLSLCRIGHSCRALHDPSSTCIGLRGTRCSSAGRCSENDGTHDFQLYAFRCVGSRSSVPSALYADGAALCWSAKAVSRFECRTGVQLCVGRRNV
jgi:hypothetical protein